MSATHDLAAIETRYAELLQELADLYQLRARLKRAAAEQAGADDGAAHPTGAVDSPDRAKAQEGRPALRLLAGGRARQEVDADAVSLTQRLAEKQGTRARLRLLAGGRAAS